MLEGLFRCKISAPHISPITPGVALWVDNHITNRHYFLMDVATFLVVFPLIKASKVTSDKPLLTIGLVLLYPIIFACKIIVYFVEHRSISFLVRVVWYVFYTRVVIKECRYQSIHGGVHHWHKSLNHTIVRAFHTNIVIEFPVSLPSLMVVLLCIKPRVVKLLQPFLQVCVFSRFRFAFSHVVA